MNKVYVVTGGWNYEGSDVKAVFANEAEAEAYAKEIENGFDYVEITEWEVK